MDLPHRFQPAGPNHHVYVLPACLEDHGRWPDLGENQPDLTYADPETLGETGGIITNDMNGPEIYATVFALAPSNFDINTIWAGSDDGKINITRDGGKKWVDITPRIYLNSPV